MMIAQIFLLFLVVLRPIFLPLSKINRENKYLEKKVKTQIS